MNIKESTFLSLLCDLWVEMARCIWNCDKFGMRQVTDAGKKFKKKYVVAIISLLLSIRCGSSLYMTYKRCAPPAVTLSFYLRKKKETFFILVMGLKRQIKINKRNMWRISFWYAARKRTTTFFSQKVLLRHWRRFLRPWTLVSHKLPYSIYLFKLISV